MEGVGCLSKAGPPRCYLCLQAHSTETQLHAEVEALKGCLASMQTEAQRWREEAEHRHVELQVWP